MVVSIGWFQMPWENRGFHRQTLLGNGNDEDFRTNRSRNGRFCRALSRPDLQLLGAPRYVVAWIWIDAWIHGRSPAFCFKIQNGNDENLVFFVGNCFVLLGVIVARLYIVLTCITIWKLQPVCFPLNFLTLHLLTWFEVYNEDEAERQFLEFPCVWNGLSAADLRAQGTRRNRDSRWGRANQGEFWWKRRLKWNLTGVTKLPILAESNNTNYVL